MNREELEAAIKKLDADMLAIERERLISSPTKDRYMPNNPEYRKMLTRWHRLQKMLEIVDKPETQQLCAVATFISEG